MQRIENVIFDLGGVLLDIDYNLTRTAFEKLGVFAFDDMYSQAIADKLFQKLETGEIAGTIFFEEFNRCTRLHLSPSEITKAWNAMLLSFREESLQHLGQLRADYKIFLLSNTNYIHLNEIKKIFHLKPRDRNFEAYFDKAFYSCEIGLRKPDAACYQWTIRESGINPEQTLFIDDSAHNIEAAQKAGLQTIHLSSGMRIEHLGL